jgi:hypothetical protein
LYIEGSNDTYERKLPERYGNRKEEIKQSTDDDPERKIIR